MNKRIIEFVNKVSGYWHHGDFNMGSSVELDEKQLEEFVELIVKECAWAADFAEDTSPGDYVKKHFGVK